MAGKVLGIEIGERLIKIVETTQGSGARRVHGCAMFQTPPSAVVDGEIRDPEALSLVLKENLNRLGMNNRKVIFTIASGRIAIREVTIPPVKENKIKSIVEANAADYFPVDMSKYHITYTLQERKLTGEDAGCRLLVMAAPIVVLEGYFNLAVLMGFQVQAMDYGGNSQFRLLETLHNDGVTMYVDVSSASSVTTIMKKNTLQLQRTFPSGVDDYVLAFMGAMEKGEGDYLSALRELSTDYLTPEAAEVMKAAELIEYLGRLVGNISRITDYFNSSNWETPIGKLVLTGVGAAVSGLKEAVAEATGLPVLVMQKLDKVAAPASLAGSLPQYIACLGSAISPVDFIPERFSKAKKKEAKKKKESVTLGVLLLIFGIVAGLGLSAWGYMNYTNALGQKQDLQNKINSLAEAETVYNNFVTYNKYKDGMAVLDSALKSPNDSLRQFIEELEKKMPSEIALLSANCTKDGISMNVTVKTKLAAAKTIQQLRGFTSVRDVTAGQLAEVIDPTGIKTITFSVTCKYNYTPVVLPSISPSPSGAKVSAAPSGAAPSASASPSAAKPSDTGAAGTSLGGAAISPVAPSVPSPSSTPKPSAPAVSPSGAARTSN